jgi:putative acetyltransferase
LPNLTIRPFTAADQARVRDIFIAWNRHITQPGQEAAFEAYIARSLAEEIERIPDYYQAIKGSGFWVAEDDGEVAGMVGIERLDDIEAEVRRMYVDEPYRRRGIGRLLLEHAEDFCHGAGYARIVLSTSELQPQAKALYEAKGYELEKEVVAEAQTNRTVGGGLRRYHFVKRLRPADQKKVFPQRA